MIKEGVFHFLEFIFLRYEARWQNVVLIGNETNHQSYRGAGLSDGLTGGNIEFGTTHSANTIIGGTHERSLALVKADTQCDLNAYYIIYDDITVNDGNSTARILWQPNSLRNTITTTTANYSYQCPVNAVPNIPNGDGTEQANIILGTTPNQVLERDSYKCYLDDPSACLEAHYNPVGGKVKATTIVFPEDGTHPMPPVTKIPETVNYSGMKVVHNAETEDIILQSKNGTNLSVESLDFQAANIYARTTNGLVKTYLVTTGTSFLSNSAAYGFSADAPISVQMDGASGGINSNGATVRFYQPHIIGVELDGTPLSVSSLTTDYVEVNIPSGQYSLELLTKGVEVAVKAFLQGPLTAITMSDAIRPIVPTTSPYTSATYTLVNDNSIPTTTCIFDNADSNDAIVDWVLLELRDAADNTQVATRSALLQRDGDVVDVDGKSVVRFDGVNAGNYYVAIRHRNHLGVMMASPVWLE